MATRQVVDFFRTRFKSSDGSIDGTDLLESLKTKLLTVNVVLSDAEEKQITNPFVKEWVDELKNVVYQAEDLLDEIATLALALPEVRSSKSVVNDYCKTLQSRLGKIISKLENIAKHRDVLGLKESSGGKLYQRLPTTSLVDECKKFEALTEAKFLRTFLSLGPLSKSSSGSNYVNSSIFEMVLPNLSCLRALSLPDCKIFEFPDIFGNLKHLRFLDFSRTEIEALPKSTCFLYNLQTLILSDCAKLMEMPPEFGRLKNLQILTTFVISNSTGASSISELGGLLHLRDKLSISELQNVQDSTDAENAKLKDKEYVKEFAFCWNNNGLDQQRETDVLEKLRPHKNVEKISIQGYNGTKLPDWFGDPSFDNMVILRISDCKYCSSFPPLGQLSSLQELHIQKCPELIGKLPDHFPSLELLYIDQCCKLDFPSDDITDYRNLQDLQIKNSCDPLTKITLSFFNKLKHFQIQDCRNLNCIEVSNDLHQELKLLQHFEISNCNDLEVFSGGRIHSPNLTSFSVSNCNSLQSMPEHMHTPKLTSFSVSNCNSLESMPKYMHTPKLTSFLVSNCKSLQSMPKHMHTPKLTSNCNSLQPMPKHMNTPKLTSFSVSNCNSLQSMPEHMHAPNLTSFSVSNCNSLRSVPKHMYTPKLTSFSVSNCNSLQSLPKHIHTPKLTSNCNGFQSMPKHMHTPKLISFSVSNCNSLRSMPEHMHAPDLTSFSLESFPNGGLPPKLKTLLLEKCDRLTVHNDWGLNNKALLTCLTIIGGCSNVESFPDEGLLPASLEFIQISEFPDLETLNLNGLQHLTLLKDLRINSSCLKRLSVKGTLPISLSSLSITGHSCLTQLCQKDEGDYWPKISHIQIREINGDII
ncbi:hypothetical protein LWI29_033656 [Acer saccharum]|uniref:Rx N-terminal domain-containing protein n=1 Tax=Acer saccharum TaxID=4024 RepID=A0AA39RJH0_ACESA|nr:hypothetical protein LWI29_033656 [Acer saccharum]